jgi:NAD-dependent SIR2 family protein deacetylase
MKKKKIKKMLKETREMVEAQNVAIAARKNDIREIIGRLNKVEYSSSYATMAEEIKDIKKQISVLRNRTNVDYSSMSKGNDKLLLARVLELQHSMARQTCASCKHADKKMSENPCDTCCTLNHWEAGEE